MKEQALAFAVLAVLGGCGSCQPPEEKTQSGSTASEPAAAAPGEQPPIAPVPPAPEGGADVEDDCFVIVDASPDYGEPPLKVEFSAEVDCTSGEPTYLWDFGDGSPTSSEASPVHTYPKLGDFTASVVVTGPGGGTDSDEIDILVEE